MEDTALKTIIVMLILMCFYAVLMINVLQQKKLLDNCIQNDYNIDTEYTREEK